MDKNRSNIVNCKIDDLISKIMTQNIDQHIFLIDENLKDLYPEFLKKLSSITGCLLLYLPGGEKCKTFECYHQFLEKILASNIHRKTKIIAIGGGATSDLAGFIAATLLRGVSWAVIPTTLLSMIDAAIGGKVAINSKFGKNLIGAFHKPTDIFIAPEFLKTLPENHKLSGLGELMKYGLLSQEIANKITSSSDLLEVIKLCGKFKEELTIRDFTEQGERKSLNIGHTIGHAIEKYFKLEHGISVYHGLVLEDKLFSKDASIEHLLQKFASNLGFKSASLKIDRKDVDALVELCFKDKKMKNSEQLELVLCHKRPENIVYLTTNRETLKRKIIDSLL